jgi:hypothetical protein
MSVHDNLAAMRRVAWELLDDFLLLFDRHMRRDGARAWLPYGSLPAAAKLPVSPEEPPSSRLSCDVALGYLAAHIQRPDERRLQTAYGLLRHAFARQHAGGWFTWNYGQFEIDQVDLGTVLDTYYYFWTLVGDRLPQDIRRGIVDSTRRAIAYLKTVEQPAWPGIIQKRCGDPEHPASRRTADYRTIDVLNGNALAITAYCRGAAILGDASLVDEAARYQKNLVESFGRHVPGWWVYIERLGTREVLGPETILYQAMTALYLEPLYRARPDPALRDVLSAAMAKLDETADAQGRLDWSHESRAMFVNTQLLMLPSAAAALADVCDITAAGRRRLELVARTMYDRKAHWYVNEKKKEEAIEEETKHGQDAHATHGQDGHATQEPSAELFQIWAASDLALIILFARRSEDGIAATGH